MMQAKSDCTDDVTSRARQFLALSWQERIVLLRCMALQPLVWAGLRLAGPARMRRWITGRAACAILIRVPLDPSCLGRLTEIAGRRNFIPSTCLSRSLLLVWLLHCQGMRARLRIGVHAAGQSIVPHAWVECDGVAIGAGPGEVAPAAVFDVSMEPGARVGGGLA